MDALFGLISFVGILVFLVLIIINAMKRKKVKKYAIGVLVCFVVFVACLSAPTSSTKEESKEDAMENTVKEETLAVTEDEEEAEIFAIDPLSINGRGKSDSGRSEPQYEGLIGYVADYTITGTHDNANLLNTPWMIPIYERDKQFFDEIGEIEHKTQIRVISQELEHQGYGSYSGYLTVEDINSNEQYIIDVNNFITKPYWEYDDLVEASLIGNYVAEYKQVSDYYPVTGTKDAKKAEIEDGTLVYVVGKTHTSFGSGPNEETNPIEGIVFYDTGYEYGSGVSTYFNQKDLTLIY